MELEAFAQKFDPPLDPGISRAVQVLQEANLHTYESCQGGEGPAYDRPAVRFHGSLAEGWQALTAALHHGFPVKELRLKWTMIDGLPVGPD